MVEISRSGAYIIFFNVYFWRSISLDETMEYRRNTDMHRAQCSDLREHHMTSKDRQRKRGGSLQVGRGERGMMSFRRDEIHSKIIQE